MFDKNKDGKISSEELGCVLRTLGHEHTKQEVDDMIKNADTNGKLCLIVVYSWIPSLRIKKHLMVT